MHTNDKIEQNPGTNVNEILRSIPSVEILSQSIDHCGLPKLMVNSVIRRHLDAIRSDILNGSDLSLNHQLTKDVQEKIQYLSASKTRAVINGTGVLLHTNLGRAPLSEDQSNSVFEIATSYNNLEFDILSGKRGKRGLYVESLFSQLCEAEAATIVNNCAAALVIILKELISTSRCEVIISRSELIQIGGGFRIPEILSTSGAQLREVGTTNKTSSDDYENAISEKTALILKVHQSNFSMSGFVENPTHKELVDLGHRYKIPIVMDLGSGSILNDSSSQEIRNEPTPSMLLSEGYDLVCFSGDKLLGSVQSGIIVGKQDWVQRIKKNPFFRCLRADKLTIAYLECSAETYINQSAENSIPVHQLASIPNSELETRAKKIIEQVHKCENYCFMVETDSTYGGGTLPGSKIASIGLTIENLCISKVKMQKQLLHGGDIPIVTKIENEKLIIDLRTVLDCQDQQIVESINNLIRNNKNNE